MAVVNAPIPASARNVHLPVFRGSALGAFLLPTMGAFRAETIQLNSLDSRVLVHGIRLTMARPWGNKPSH